MLHEVLFSLWHCPGDLFKNHNEEEWVTSLELQEFLHPGERKLLQKIMRIALTYHKIEEFRKMVANQHTIQYAVSLQGGDTAVNQENQEVTSGLYLKAFCNGLDEVLNGYRKEIVNIESRIIRNPQLNLSYVLGAVENYTCLFDALNAIIRTVKVEHIYGCLLIGRLHMYTNCGISQITVAANKIIKSINTMFYRHLANWIIYGDLVDVYNEFFITDCKTDDENFLFPEQIEAGEEMDTSTVNTVKSKIRKPCRVHLFMIRPEMLPSNLPLETAETILFIGRIVWILQNDPKQNYDVLKERFRRDIWEGKSVDYYRKIQELEVHSFELAIFESCISECRLKLTKYLWSVMVEEANLLDHLQLLRDYYGLGRGELFQQFIVIAEEQLKRTPNDYIVKNLNFIFSETARKMYSENDRTYMKFELAMPRNAETKNYAANPLLFLELYFDVSWPLHIIFHPKVMSLYNKLFGFLLRVKKTHIDLHMLWLNHMAGKKKTDRGVWTLRHNLMFLVNNIQYYLQVDVIEAQFSLLKEAIKNANEFNDIIRLHSTFLSNLLSKTFVMVLDKQTETRHSLYQLPSLNFESKNMVYNIILLLLELCDEFCLMASTWDSELTEPELKVLEDLQSKSDSIIEMLLRALFSLHKQVSGCHLLQLLHRLDFNRWYTKSKPDLNLTVS